MVDSMQEFADRYHNEMLDELGVEEIICIDGKAENGTVQENERNPDIVSAYSFNTGITLATEAYQEKSNKNAALQKVLQSRH